MSQLEPSISSVDVQVARRGLRQFLVDTASEFKRNRTAIGIDALCIGVEVAVPVPILGKALSNAIRSALTDSVGAPALPLEEVIATLDAMQESDEGFANGMRNLGADLDLIAADVRDLRCIITEQRRSSLVLRRPRVEDQWPVFDSTISAVIANAGGGSVYVDEIFLDVEAWEPERSVDYSVPAAPLPELRLKAELSTARREYPLLALNGQSGDRQYGERGAGAERMTIDLSSVENARYSLRVRLPYTDIDEQTGVVTYPPEDDAPILLGFCVAPAWHPVDVQRLHDGGAIYRDLVNTLGGVGAALRSHLQTGDDAAFGQELDRLHVPRASVESFSRTAFVLRFVPVVADLVAYGDREAGLDAVMRLLLHVDSSTLERLGQSEVPDAVTRLAAGDGREPLVAAFLAAPSGATARDRAAAVFP